MRVMERKNWKVGVAFVRGINIYKSARITQNKILKLCKKLEGDNIRILRIVNLDNIIFKKSGIHYAAVGSKLEKMLTSYFKKPVYVTTRSMKTVGSLK